MAIVKTKKGDLNIHYEKYFQLSMILSLFLLIAAFRFSPKAKIQVTVKDIPEGPIKILNNINTTQITKPPIPPKPKVPEIATDEEIEDILFDPTDIDFDAKLNVPAKLEKPSNRIVEDENAEFIVVEEMPTIVGGLASIIKNIHYTELAKRLDIEGRVVIELLVKKMERFLKQQWLKVCFLN